MVECSFVFGIHSGVVGNLIMRSNHAIKCDSPWFLARESSESVGQLKSATRVGHMGQ